MNAAQCRMARAALQLGVRDLAQLAKVSPATVVRFEASVELKERTVDAIRSALESAGVEFTNGDQPGVRLRKASTMQEKERLSRQEIEARCLAVLRQRLGLKHITHVRIGPYKGPKGRTWQVIEVGPDVGQKAFKDAEDEIAKLQGTFDLA